MCRMEDPGEEWELEEYYASSPGGGGCKSTVSWILNRGLQLGKKVVITGVVISSAPLVLPPLVVVTALGFAVSVPFGVVFASYACTEKLMNKLLPMPANTRQLEYDTGLMVDAEEDYKFAEEFLWEEELEKQIADKKEDEMRVELVEDAKGEQQEGHVVGDEGLKDIGEDEEEKLHKNESFKEKGYEEDVGEYLEREDEGSLAAVNIKIEGVEKVDKASLVEESKNEKLLPKAKRAMIVRAGDKKKANDMTKTDELVVVARVVPHDIKDVEKVTSSKEEKELKEGTAGLPEKNREEGEVGESVKKNKKKNKHQLKKSHGVGKNKEDKHGKSTKEMNEKLNKQLGEKGEETVLDAKKGSQQATAEGSRAENIVADDRSSTLASQKPAGHQETLTNGNHAPKNSKSVEVELNPGAVSQGSRAESNVSDEQEVNSVGSSAQRSETG